MHLGSEARRLESYKFTASGAIAKTQGDVINPNGTALEWNERTQKRWDKRQGG